MWRLKRQPRMAPRSFYTPPAVLADRRAFAHNLSAILHRVAQFTNACHLNADDRFVLLSSTGTIAGIGDIFSALLNGATLVIAEPSRVGFDGILLAMDRGQITICYALPALLRSLSHLREAASAFRHVRILRLGGDVVRERDIALVAARLRMHAIF
jgi:acyl-coenzyme A synthetase/AMP-(fatty) acid ligase